MSRGYYLGKIPIGNDLVSYSGPYTVTYFKTVIVAAFRKMQLEGKITYAILYSLTIDFEKQTIKKTIIEEWWKPQVETIEINVQAKQL